MYHHSRMTLVLDNFFDGNFTDVSLLCSLSALRLGRQYVATTDKVCTAVRIEREIPLSMLELLYLQEESARCRQNGIDIACTMSKNFRYEGKFFKDILEKTK